MAAAITAFGFVFIHPFDDGNGRIHRFLVHHILTKAWISLRLGFCIPFPLRCSVTGLPTIRFWSAFQLRSCLSFVMTLILQDGMAVHNDTAPLYRYFDATAQAEYLYQCIEETIHRDLRDELGFIAVFDAALRAVLNIVDMPNRRASLLIKVHSCKTKADSPRANVLPFPRSPTKRSIELKRPSGEAWQDAHPAQVPEYRS